MHNVIVNTQKSQQMIAEIEGTLENDELSKYLTQEEKDYLLSVHLEHLKRLVEFSHTEIFSVETMP